MRDLLKTTAIDAVGAMREGALTSAALVEACLERIAERDGDLRAWAFVDPDLALSQARSRDAETPRGPLHGDPKAPLRALLAWGAAPHPGSVARGDPTAPRRFLAGAHVRAGPSSDGGDSGRPSDGATPPQASCRSPASRLLPSDF